MTIANTDIASFKYGMRGEPSPAFSATTSADPFAYGMRGEPMTVYGNTVTYPPAAALGTPHSPDFNLA